MTTNASPKTRLTLKKLMLRSGFAEQFVEADILLFIEPERVLVTRSFRFRSISEGGLSGWYPYMA